MGPTGKDAAKRKFLQFLSRSGVRLTNQRRVIVDVVFETDQHFTAEQLLQWARKRDASVSRATVYRALPLLAERGLLREMDFGGDFKVYDPNYAERPNHSHIICEDCHQIFEFENEEMTRLEAEIARAMGFKIRMRRLQFTAACEEFRRFGRCSKRATA